MLKIFRLTIPLVLGILLFALAFVPADRANGFKATLGETDDCSQCHTLTVEEASSIIQSMNPSINVEGIAMGPVEGLWEVVIEARGKKGIAYIDFSKRHIITGSVLKVSTRENLTSLKLYDLSKVDLSAIPLNEAIVMGKPDAKYKVIVFDDPDWPYCKKLHLEMKNIMKERDDILFYIKMYPLKSHPAAYDKSRAIVCAKSLKMLDDAFAGKKLPKPSCETSEVDDTIKLAESLGITATPTVILPDGAIVPGYKDAAALVALIEQAGEAVGISKDEDTEEATEEAEEESEQGTDEETSEAAD